MANPFLVKGHDEIETAIMLEKAHVADIGKAVAYTDGDRVFINTEDNLYSILPAYSTGMLKWLLWHERYHMELRHHNRFFKYVGNLTEEEAEKKLGLTHKEVNIIMDILVHDSLAKMFPELVETAMENLAQMRNRNSLGYTFTAFTLEEMLDEYRAYKNGEENDGDEGKGRSADSGEGEESEGESEDGSERKKSKSTKSSSEKESSEPTPSDKPSTCTGGEEEREEKDTSGEETPTAGEHEKTDWSKLDDIDTKEFIKKEEGDKYMKQIEDLKRTKLKLAKLAKTLNGLATTTKQRTYRQPSVLQPADGCIFKGKLPGKTDLYLVFDASGSMGSDMETFKEIISKSIPQAMKCPCEWFSGYGSHLTPYKTDRGEGYYKATFKDFMGVRASGGYSDDGDRTIELCWLAEQKGYSPIGVTDGGGCIEHQRTYKYIRELKRTVLVGQQQWWLDKVRKENPHIKTICTKVD